jgi:ligand-binding SRPBCC domain-containing protein
MHIKIKTSVPMDYKSVAARFNADLFQALTPPFPPVRLLRFDGSSKGDEVHLELNFIIFKQIWKSLIIEDATSTQEVYFIDEGFQLPFFLKYWRHKHRIVKDGDHTKIIDDITFHTPFFLI